MGWGSHRCFLQMMWFWWHHQSVTFSTHRIDSQPDVKQLEWGPAPLNLRPWFSAENRWTVHFEYGVSPYPKWRSSGIWGTTEQEIGRRIGAVGAVLRSLYLTAVTRRQLNQKAKFSIYRSIFVPSLSYGHEGWIATERMRYGYEWLKWVSSRGWPASPF